MNNHLSSQRIGDLGKLRLQVCSEGHTPRFGRGVTDVAQSGSACPTVDIRRAGLILARPLAMRRQRAAQQSGGVRPEG
jgi:hypothetical protein